MQILHINASYKPAYIYGGPTVSVSKLCEELGKLGVGSRELGDRGQESEVRGVENGKWKVKSEDRRESEIRSSRSEVQKLENDEPSEGFDFLPNGQAGAQPDIQVSVYTTLANGKEALPYISGVEKNVEGVSVKYFKRLTKDHSHFSPALLWHLWKTVKNYDVIHIHAWWNLVSVLSALICVIKGKKYILSPRGTLSNYSFGNGKSFVKQVFHSWIGKPLLNKAIFQVSSEKEKRDIINLVGPLKSITVIPNFVELTNAWGSTIPAKGIAQPKLLFFSRVEEKKGLEFLLQACSLLNFPFNLAIAGDGQEEYLIKLKSLASQLNITPNINWLGQIAPDKKFQTLAEYDLLVLPSYDENFANVVIESLACGTAVLLSPHVGLADYVKDHKLGWICSQKPEDIAETLRTIFKSQLEHLMYIRKYGPAIIKEDYNETNLRNAYINYYQSVL